LLISKLQAVLGLAILIVATAAISAIVVSKWNPFPPNDYEDCAARAAKDAKSKDALSVLLSICGSEFKGRRKAGGGYTYYDSCQDRTIDIKGPNPTPAELNDIKQQCRTYIEAQEQMEALQEQHHFRRLEAIANVHARLGGFRCSLPDICDLYVNMKVEVTNGSKEALTSVSVGLAFVPTNGTCPSSYAEQHKLSLKLSPGETRADEVKDIDAALSKRRVCIAVVDVEFADNVEWCGRSVGVPSPNQMIDGCSAVIEAGRGGAPLSWAFNNRGSAYLDKRDYDRAIADYDQAIRLDPKNANVYTNRGNAYRSKGDYDRAIADQDQAIRLDPKYALAYNNRGSAYGSKGDYDRAIADYDQAIRLDPKSALAYRNRGSEYGIKGDYDRAIADEDQAIRLDPKYAKAYFTRGLLNIYAGALPKPLADLNQASELDPKYPYTELWLDIVNKRSNLPSRLAQAMAQIDMTKWPAPVIRLYLGQLTPAAVYAAADDPNANTKRGQSCGANFFSGELALQQGVKVEAARLFRLAAADCPKDFIERPAANEELKALGEGR
jgi:lipoprotein NlpI